MKGFFKSLSIAPRAEAESHDRKHRMALNDLISLPESVAECFKKPVGRRNTSSGLTGSAVLLRLARA